MATLYTRERSPYWYGSFYLDGKRVRFGTDHTDRKKAQAQADERESLAKISLENQGGLRLMEAADLFFKSKPLRPRTVESYEGSLSSVRGIMGDFLLLDLTAEGIACYIRKRQAMKGLTVVRADLAFLSSLYTSAGHWEPKLKKRNPIREYDKKGLAKPQERSTWLTERQVDEMLEACLDDMHRGLVTLAVDTGMRKQEILRLHKSEVDLNNGTITMGNKSDLRTKTGKGRIIPLTHRAWNALAKQIEAQNRSHSQTHWTGFVFENPTTGQPITTVKTFWLAMCKRANLEGVRFHDLRHTFATRGLHLGADATSIMAITGHKSAASFKRYTHASDESKLRVINLMQQSHIGPTTPNKSDHTREGE